MKTMHTQMNLNAGLGAVVIAGCGANVPAHPTWQDDVYPIMLARCVRCHDGAGTMDPLYMPQVAAPGNFDHTSFDDFMGADKIYFLQAKTRIVNPVPALTMPPLPAAKLADWQVQTIANFIDDNMSASP